MKPYYHVLIPHDIATCLLMCCSSLKAVDEHGNFTVKDMTMPYNIAKDNKIKVVFESPCKTYTHLKQAQ